MTYNLSAQDFGLSEFEKDIEKQFTNIKELLLAMKKFVEIYPNTTILRADDPKRCRVGYLLNANGYYNYFTISIYEIKKDKDFCSLINNNHTDKEIKGLLRY